LNAASSGCSDTVLDPYPKIDIPIYADAFNKDVFIDYDKKIKSVNYRIRMEYPPKGVVSFYEVHLNRIGFIQKEINEPKWESFIDDTLDGSPKIRQLLTTWVNEDLHIEAFLALVYRKNGNKWSDDLNVTCQLQPLVDVSNIEMFLKELKAAGDEIYTDFMKLLDSYKDENGQVDIERAVKENKGNIYLQRYKKIVDEINKQLGH
jgi:hypothetical protein